MMITLELTWIIMSQTHTHLQCDVEIADSSLNEVVNNLCLIKARNKFINKWTLSFYQQEKTVSSNVEFY